MTVLEPTAASHPPHGSPVREDVGGRAARQALRAQCARLEAELADCVATAFGDSGDPLEATAPTVLPAGRRAAGPRLLGLGELELLRDRLAGRVGAARSELAVRSAAREDARRRLEAMLLAPGRHRFERVTNRELGEGGCGVWQVKPRLGLVGVLAGWWEVKLSSGCP